MDIASVLADIARRGLAVRRVTADSRAVRPGDVFIALRGARFDGRDFIPEAMVRGAVAIVAEAADEPGPDLATVAADMPRPPVYFVDALVPGCGALADGLLGEPSRRLWLAGVTGTNGKTSITHWIAQALGALGTPCAVVGTLGAGLPGTAEEARNTTPDAPTLHSLLAEFCDQGIPVCAMEVSSIGIEQGRVNAARFDVAVFANLTRDHLDYHGDMGAYGAAKARLFQWPDLGAAVVNADDAFGRELLRQLPAGVRRIAYATDAGNFAAVSAADEVLCPVDVRLGGATLGFTLDGVVFSAPVVGQFNLSNLLAVIGVLRIRGLSLAQIAQALPSIRAPAGRMQVLGGEGEPLVVVDYAHTPDALEKVLGTLRATARARGGKLVCVFGCGGDRDPGKRPLMGRIAERLADETWVTSDNPRSEAPQAIVGAIAAGMAAPEKARVEVDRGRAIAGAIAAAAASDVVVIAGKGHEPYQEIAGVRHPFSDLAAGKSALAGRDTRVAGAVSC